MLILSLFSISLWRFKVIYSKYCVVTSTEVFTRFSLSIIEVETHSRLLYNLFILLKLLSFCLFIFISFPHEYCIEFHLSSSPSCNVWVSYLPHYTTQIIFTCLLACLQTGNNPSSELAGMEAYRQICFRMKYDQCRWIVYSSSKQLGHHKHYTARPSSRE